MVKYKIFALDEYNKWFKNENHKSKRQILKRLSMIEEEGHFGHMKYLNDDLYELKFNDGKRIYYIVIPVDNVILLLGGNKNGQDKDIKKARGIIAKTRIET